MPNKPFLPLLGQLFLPLAILTAIPAAAENLRPPAVPLVTHDPYFSIWSAADKLTDNFPSHWTGKTHGMSSMIRVGGKAYRLMGDKPKSAPEAEQTGLKVTATQSTYTFTAGDAKVELNFLSPILPDDLALASRPLSYLSWKVTCAEPTQVYFDISGEWCVNEPKQKVAWQRETHDSLQVLRMGAADQLKLINRGDDLRIEWGYGYLALPKAHNTTAIGGDELLREGFIKGEALPKTDDAKQPRAVNDAWPVMAAVLDFGPAKEGVTKSLALAYDDIHSIRYFDDDLQPFWRHGGQEMLKSTQPHHPSVLDEAFGPGPHGLTVCKTKADAFDAELAADMTAAGGEAYAQLGALCYRQAWAGNKLCADANGRPLLFPKENFSNGCIATVDVIYPMAPLFLLLGPDVAKAQLVPILDYAMTPKWKFPFAPHDLGTYPHATGQVYGGGEKTEDNQMPVEESGNMLLLLAAVAQAEGNADFCTKYWPALTRWAAYLKEKGLDPENQLCTDDFSGHLAHNTNLSIKAILALAAYGKLAERRGDAAVAKEYHTLAADYAKRWEEMAKDGDHYKLAFDKAGTWSQKYNLVWDKLLGLNLFPETIAKTEMAYYRSKQQPYGTPLDNRSTYSKLDWITWTATLTRNPEDFAALVNPLVKMANTTKERLPLTDWYFTDSAKFKGFVARPVVGGIFLEMLYHPKVWQKWFTKGVNGKGAWAPINIAVYENIVPSSENAPQTWAYSTEKPADDWSQPAFAATGWKEGPGSFGSKDTPGAVVRTEWTSKDIWIRRRFDLPATADKDQVVLWLSHDDDAEVFINGEPAAMPKGYTTGYVAFPISPAVKAKLQPTGNWIAIHCHNDRNGQNIDAGFAVRQKLK